MVNHFATPLGPALVLLLGALALIFMRRRLPRWVPWVTALVTVVSAAGVLLWLVLSGGPERFARAWDPVALPGGTWLWQINGWSWLAETMLLLLGAASVLLAWDESDAATGPTLAATLLLMSAASFFVLSGNLLTLAASWIMLDVAVRLRAAVEGAASDGRTWGLSGLGVVLLMAALLFAGPAGARQALSEETAPATVLALMLVALVRCGIYPFQLWLRPEQQRGRNGLVLLYLLAPLSGLWLLGQVHSLAGPYWRSQPVWAAAGVSGMLGSGLAAWLADSEWNRTAWAAINRISLAFLAAAMVPQSGPVAIVWPLTALTLGMGSLIVGQAIWRRWGWRQPSVLAVLTLIGLPGTPGFAARFVLTDFAARPPVFWPLWLMALLAESLLVAALLPGPFAPRPRRSPRVTPGAVVRLLAGAVLLAVPLLLWGLLPPILVGFAGLPADDPIVQPLLGQVRQLSLIDWAVLLLPWAGGILLSWGRERILADGAGWSERVRRVVRLDWGRGFQRWAVERAADALRGLGTVLEGEGYLGWLGLAALLGWLLWNL
jgi:formate hydrogenlyase subunit 3/multisubunit Na+/H+ antiporter MnhD subunit